MRLQTQPTPAPGQPPKFTGALDCFWKTVRTEGVKTSYLVYNIVFTQFHHQVRGLYKGMSSPLMGVPPIYAVVFGAYGQAKRWLRKDEDDPLTLSQIFLAGCITGIATTVRILPSFAFLSLFLILLFLL